MLQRTAFLLGVAVPLGVFLLPSLRSEAPRQTTILLCDGKTQVAVPNLAPGQKMDRPQAQGVADRLMSAWLSERPGTEWRMPQYSTMAVFALAQESTQNLPPDTQSKQHELYNRDSAADDYIRQAEFDKFVAEGKRIFHNADAFGGTVGVSCDMCHPDAANTHPETYPKYQVELQRVALLRDMINWCIEHPTKGKPLADGDMRLRAMEAYILAQRTGHTLEPGKR